MKLNPMTEWRARTPLRGQSRHHGFMSIWSGQFFFEGVALPLMVEVPWDYGYPPERIFLDQDNMPYPDIAGGSPPEHPCRLFIRCKDDENINWQYKRHDEQQRHGPVIRESYEFIAGGRRDRLSVPLQSHGLPAERVYVDSEGVHPDDIDLPIKPDSARTYLRQSDESGRISYLVD